MMKSLAVKVPSSPLPLLLLLLQCQPSLQANTWGIEANSISSDAWDSLARPNASNSISFPGYNLSETYPGSPAEDWALTVSVFANVPLPEADSEDESYFTATEISFEPPSGLESELGPEGPDPSWSLCQHYFLSRRLTSSDEGGVRGDCEGVLKEECVVDLRKSLRDGFGDGTGGSSIRCTYADLPRSCLDDFTNGEEEREMDINDYDTIANPWGFSSAQWGIRFGKGNHSADDTDDYDTAIRQVWVAGFVWGSRNESYSTGRTSTPEGEVRCISASDVRSGSRTFEDEAGRVGEGGRAWLALVIGVVVAGVML